LSEQKNPKEPKEQLPISSFYKVIDQVTIFKSEKWWEAIVVIESFGRRSIAMYLWQVIESFGRRSIAMYLWQSRDGKWKRKHKFQIRNPEEWEKVKTTVDLLTSKLSSSKVSMPS